MQKQRIEIEAQKRTRIGKSLDALRKQNFLPAVLYGHNFDSIPIQVNLKEFEKVYSEAGESSLVYVNLDGNVSPVIIYDIARNSVSDKFIHIDFYKVKLDEKITTDVPLVFINESPAVKDLSGILVKNINEIEVEALPTDLPHEITVDISVLRTFTDQILIKNLALPKGVEIKRNPEEIIALVQEQISEEELEKQLATSETSAEEVEVIKRPDADIDSKETDEPEIISSSSDS